MPWDGFTVQTAFCGCLNIQQFKEVREPANVVVEEDRWEQGRGEVSLGAHQIIEAVNGGHGRTLLPFLAVVRAHSGTMLAGVQSLWAEFFIPYLEGAHQTLYHSIDRLLLLGGSACLGQEVQESN